MASYAKSGPPFNFLGHMTETQKEGFYSWLDQQDSKQSDITKWYQIRAQQMRKTAGVLEDFYQKQRNLKPSFQKDEWQPGKDGHFTYVNRNDQEPSITVSRIKEHYQEALQLDDEGVFWMNWLRKQIEFLEDKANCHNETPTEAGKLRGDLDKMFDLPEYDAVLVKDQSRLYKGQPYFRVNPLDEPTIWEKEQFSHAKNRAVKLKMPEGDL